MSIELKKISDCEVILTEVVEGEEWKQAQQESFNRLKQNLHVKGFRNGRVPDSYARAHIHPQLIISEAVEPIANRVLNRGIEEHLLDLLESPTLELGESSPESVEISIRCKVEPVVEIDYENIEIEKPDDQLTYDEYKEAYANTLEQFANWVVDDEGEVENGDQLLIDAKSLADEGPFKDYEIEEAEVLMGQYPEYEKVYEQLLGMKPEESRQIEIEFDEEHTVPFEITIEQIEKKELPELDDAFFAENNLAPTKKEFDIQLGNQLQDLKSQMIANDHVEKVLQTLVERLEDLDVPESLIEGAMQNLVQQYINQQRQAGLDVSELIERVKMDRETYAEPFREQAMDLLKSQAIMAAIARAEGMKLNPAVSPRSLAKQMLYQQVLAFLTEK